MRRGEARARRRTHGRSYGRTGPRARLRGLLGGVAGGFGAGDQPLRPGAGEPRAPGAVEGGDARVLRAGRGRGRALARSFRAVRRFAVDVPDEVGSPRAVRPGAGRRPAFWRFLL